MRTRVSATAGFIAIVIPVAASLLPGKSAFAQSFRILPYSGEQSSDASEGGWLEPLPYNRNDCKCAEYLSRSRWGDKIPGRDYRRLPFAKDLLNNREEMAKRGHVSRQGAPPRRGDAVIFDTGARLAIGRRQITINSSAGHAGYVLDTPTIRDNQAVFTMRHANWNTPGCASGGCLSDGGCDNVRDTRVTVPYQSSKVSFWAKDPCGARRSLGDVNCDSIVNALDLSIVIDSIGTRNPKADVNADGMVNTIDYGLVSEHVGQRYR